MSDYCNGLDSPIGRLTVVVDSEGRLVRLSFSHLAAETGAIPDQEGRCAAALTQLREYLAGDRRSFSLPLAPRGTPFQQRVWQELQRIPFGSTISYRELAGRVGNPAACRAVARANASNPIAIVVPCHRVIGSDGTLTGYGGGLERKRFLLELEGAAPPEPGSRQAALAFVEPARRTGKASPPATDRNGSRPAHQG